MILILFPPKADNSNKNYKNLIDNLFISNFLEVLVWDYSKVFDHVPTLPSQLDQNQNQISSYFFQFFGIYYKN